jgi:regulator of nucleoside diphosphate kinase
MSIPTADGGLETLTVHEVVYQPEAARRERLKLAGNAVSGSWRQGGLVLRVVHRSDKLRDKAVNKVMAAFDTGFDDPGPSAA